MTGAGCAAARAAAVFDLLVDFILLVGLRTRGHQPPFVLQVEIDHLIT